METTLGVRTPTAAEITRDIIIACINRSNAYNPVLVNEHTARNQLALLVKAYREIFQTVKELGTE